MFKAHSRSSVFLGLQASSKGCSLNTCCVEALSWAHSSHLAGERNHWWETADSTGLDMMTERQHGGGGLAQGLELQRPGKGSPDKSFEQAPEEGGLQAGKDFKGPQPRPAQLRCWGWGCGGVPGGWWGTGLRKPRRLG